MSDPRATGLDQLSPVTRSLILHWGAMGTRWGVNRTVAQIHALLYVSAQPLNAERITEILGVARSNVSTSLRELQAWGLIRLVPVPGDRREHFESVADVWQMFHIVLQERKKREFDPTLEVLRGCVTDLESSGESEEFAAGRLRAMLEFFESTTGWYDEIRRLPTGALRRLMKMGAKVRQLVEPKKRRRRA